MATLAGLSEQETNTLEQAFLAGQLSDEQKQQIIAMDQPKPEAPKKTLESETGGEVSRFRAITTGAMTGAALGTPAGPVGVLAGGALGAAIGSVGFDNLENLTDFLGLTESGGQPLSETISKAGQAAKEDVLFSGGFMGAGALFRSGKPILGKLFGVRNEEARLLAEEAKALNIGVGAADIAQGTGGAVSRGSIRVAGIFPIIGGPVRKAGVTKADEIITRTNDIINRMAPNAVLADELGIDMVKAARGSITEFRTTAATLYDNFRSLAAKANVPIVPMDAVKKSAVGFVEQIERGKIRLKSGAPQKFETFQGTQVPIISTEQGEILSGPAADSLGAFLKKLKRLPDRITVSQYDSLVGDLQDFIGKASADGFDIKRVVTIKKALEESLGDMVTKGVNGGEEIKAALDAANSFYSKGIVQFQTATAQKFGRVDKNFARVGPVKPGSLNDDELALVAVNLRSPRAIKDLRKLVGADNVGAAARRHVENAWDASLVLNREGKIKGFDWDGFGKELGLIGKRPERRAVVEEMLKGTKTSLTEIESLIRVASKIEVPTEVSQFIARRAALGGMTSALGGATAAVMIADSFIASIGVGLLLRHGGKILSDPKRLKAMQAVLDTSGDTALRRAFLGKLLDATLGVQEQADLGAGA